MNKSTNGTVGGATFSVVTPNYNMADYLGETIESVLKNLKPGDEYYVIDGGSRDNSVDVINRYKSYLTGWVSEPDNGYAEALDKGFRRCKGDYLCYINSGDLLLGGALEAARRVLSESDADFIFGDDVLVDESGRVLVHSHGNVGSLKNMMLYGGWTPLQDACFWRKVLYQSIGGIDPSLKYAADYDLFLRGSIYGKCVYVPIIFSAFRRHDNQKSVSKSKYYEMERQLCRQKMLEKMNVGRLMKFVAGTYFWILVRWRHHVLRRIHRSSVTLGGPVKELSVS